MNCPNCTINGLHGLPCPDRRCENGTTAERWTVAGAALSMSYPPGPDTIYRRCIINGQQAWEVDRYSYFGGVADPPHRDEPNGGG
jgi:hypothetical protein